MGRVLRPHAGEILRPVPAVSGVANPAGAATGTVAVSVESTNYQKFQTRNPVVRRLIDGFYEQVSELVGPLEARSALDAGCGEGETMLRLGSMLGTRRVGIDLDEDAVALARERVDGAEIFTASLYELPFEADEFDLVLCREVLEHLNDPGAAVDEIARTSGSDIVISVPFEPWFRLGSAMRGKYLRTFGNHPEHVNHWSRRTLREFLSAHVQVVELRVSAPWLIAHCRPLGAGR
jgi:ubiquinone/menaquinone biosynthesis C-methylase UbiE